MYFTIRILRILFLENVIFDNIFITKVCVARSIGHETY